MILVFFVLFCFVGPLVYHTNQTITNPLVTDLPPSGGHPLGTDENGFDELGRIMLGGQTALEIGFFAVADRDRDRHAVRRDRRVSPAGSSTAC